MVLPPLSLMVFLSMSKNMMLFPWIINTLPPNKVNAVYASLQLYGTSLFRGAMDLNSEFLSPSSRSRILLRWLNLNFPIKLTNSLLFIGGCHTPYANVIKLSLLWMTVQSESLTSMELNFPARPNKPLHLMTTMETTFREMKLTRKCLTYELTLTSLMKINMLRLVIQKPVDI